MQQGRELRVCVREGLVRGTSASLLEEVSGARRGVRDVKRRTSPAGGRILGVRVLQEVTAGPGVVGGYSWSCCSFW